MKTLKEKVLQKCAELKETEHNEVKIFVRGLRNLGGVSLERYGLVAKWLDVTVDPSYPPDHPVWPLAAQVLGIVGDAPKEDKDIDFLRWSIDPERKVADTPRADYVTILFDDHYQSERFVSALRRILTQ